MFLRRFVSIVSFVSILAPAPAGAQTSARIGFLTCDLSAGIGLILIQKQSMTCTFRPNGGGSPERYVGTVSEYGIELGGVERGHLVWAVAAATQGVPAGALAGTYAGVAAGASFGAGGGASVLIGGTGRAFSLQPVSVEGEIGLNFAAGVRTISLRPAS